MLLAESALKGYAIEADDGSIGTVHDCLFDETTWKLRWLVIDTRSWLMGRKVLIHPSAAGQPDIADLRLPVHLTKAQIKASPAISFDLPVSEQIEKEMYGYYGWEPQWGVGASYIGPDHGDSKVLERLDSEYKTGLGDGDPKLQSVAAITGCPVEATDGSIGHVQDCLIDGTTWDVRYLIVNTSNWWFGQHVLLSPHAVRQITWAPRKVLLNVTRDRVKNSPPWSPIDLIDESYQRRLHGYYDWPGYGW